MSHGELMEPSSIAEEPGSTWEDLNCVRRQLFPDGSVAIGAMVATTRVRLEAHVHSGLSNPPHDIDTSPRVSSGLYLPQSMRCDQLLANKAPGAKQFNPLASAQAGPVAAPVGSAKKRTRGAFEGEAVADPADGEGRAAKRPGALATTHCQIGSIASPYASYVSCPLFPYLRATLGSPACVRSASPYYPTPTYEPTKPYSPASLSGFPAYSYPENSAYSPSDYIYDIYYASPAASPAHPAAAPSEHSTQDDPVFIPADYSSSSSSPGHSPSPAGRDSSSSFSDLLEPIPVEGAAHHLQPDLLDQVRSPAHALRRMGGEVQPGFPAEF